MMEEELVINEQRRKVYLSLIDALHNCHSAEQALEIINSCHYLIEGKIVKSQIQLAANLEKIGINNVREFLEIAINVLKQKVNKYQCQRTLIYDTRIFISNLIVKILKSDCNPEVIIPLVKSNLDKLDDNFCEVLQSYARDTLTTWESPGTRGIAIAINDFCNIIREFPLGNKANNVEIAITGYELALTVFLPEVLPERWAMLQNNLGVAYGERLRGDPAENLETSIRHYQNALQVYTLDFFPERWAFTQINLGAAYSNRLLGQTKDNLNTAINCYQKALKFITYNNFKEAWIKLIINLALAYSDVFVIEQNNNWDKMIECYEEALLFCHPGAYPELWAQIQNNLGLAYSNYSSLQGEVNLKKAINCYQKALRVYTRKAFEQHWAMVKNNLGIALRRAGNLELAIVCYQDALQVRTREGFPKEYAETKLNLGLAYKDSRLFSQAYIAFASAIATVQSLRNEIISGDAIKQRLAEIWINLYRSMVEVCLELATTQPRYYAKAIEYVERSKTRNLVELLATRDLYPKGNISETILNKLKYLRQEIAAEQRRLDIEQRNHSRNGAIISKNIDQQLSSSIIAAIPDRNHLNQLRQQLDELLTKHIQPIDSNFSLTQRVEAISFQQIRELLPDGKTALIEWYIMGETVLTFIITRQAQYPIVWQFSHKDLKALVDWSKEYLRDYYEQKDKWQTQLSQRLSRLAEILHINEILAKIPEGCDHLILIPHRFLHLFPLHALPIGGNQCLLERFKAGIRYAPSCQLLQQAQNQKRLNFSHLFAVSNPTKDRPYTELAVEAIRRHFNLASVLVGEQATKAALNNTHSEYLRSAHCILFACHGIFNLESPLESGLFLANEKLFTLDELFSLDLRECRLVTLMACETGLTDFTSISDEYIGLPSAFLVAGSSSMISSLWGVPQGATAFLMIELYENLRIQSNLALSLQKAQLWLRNVTNKELKQWIKEKDFIFRPILGSREWIKLLRSFNKDANSKPFESPYYWAAFCAIG